MSVQKLVSDLTESTLDNAEVFEKLPVTLPYDVMILDGRSITENSGGRRTYTRIRLGRPAVRRKFL